MPKLEITIPHDLSQAEALNRIQQFIPELKAQHSDRISDLEESWLGNTGSFKFKISGFKVEGDIEVNATSVVIRGSIPFLALAFKGQIESTIRQKAEELLRK